MIREGTCPMLIALCGLGGLAAALGLVRKGRPSVVRAASGCGSCPVAGWDWASCP
jgi:hypothetical protein